MFIDPLPIGQILGHTGKQQKDAVPTASEQDSIECLRTSFDDSPRNPLGLLRKRDRHPDNLEVFQPARQAQRFKRRYSIGTIAPPAARSLDATAPRSCKVSRFNASKLAGDRGGAVVARRDAPMVGQGDHLSQVPDGCDNRCIKPRLGWLVVTLWPLRQASPRGKRLLATVGGGHEQQCSGALRRQLDGQGRPRTLPKLSYVGGDRQHGNSCLYQSFGWPISIFKQHCPGSLVDMLLGTDPPRRGPSPRQGECTSRSLIPLEAGSHQHLARPEGLPSYRSTLRPTLGGPLCDPGQQSTRPLRVLEARPIGDRRQCLHVPDEGGEPLLLSSCLMHPSATPRGASAASNNNFGRP